MHGVEESNQCARPTVRRRVPFANVLQPGDLTHHALLRDLHPAVFPWALRELHRRLYDGAVQGSENSRRVALRQGFPLRWSATLFALGWFLLAGCIVTGSDLGRSFRLLDGSGGTAQAAAPVPSQAFLTASEPWLLWGGLALVGSAVLMSLCTRRHFFLVAQRNDSGLVDLWISGTSWRSEERFDDEFADFVRRVEENDRARPEQPQASQQGP